MHARSRRIAGEGVGLASGAVYDPNMTTQRCRNQNDASEPIV